jgi:hypothetical protein
VTVKYFVLAALPCVVAGLLAGCGKHTRPASTQTPPPDIASTEATNPEAAHPGPLATAPPELPTPAGTDEATAPSAPADLSMMTLDLHHWIGAHQRIPKNFEEYAASARAPIPPPPAGKKYAINSIYQVILQDK